MIAKSRTPIIRGSLERRVRWLTFSLSMMLALVLGAVVLMTQIQHAQQAQRDFHLASLGLLASTLRFRIEHQIGIVDELSHNPLTWTALSDSRAHDSYLAPLLDSLNLTHAGSMSVSLLDYQGRRLSGAPSRAPAESVLPLVERTLSSRQASAQMLGGHDTQHLLLAFPVLEPYSGAVNGILLANMAIADVVQSTMDDVERSLGYRVLLNDQELLTSALASGERYQPVHADISPLVHPSLYTLHVELFGTASAWHRLITQQSLLLLFTSLLLAWGIWRLTDVLAKRLTHRLTLLSKAVLDNPLPSAEAIPLDEHGDEISLLSNTLRSALSEQARIMEQLEERVAARTQELFISQQRYQLAVDGSRDGIWDWDLNSGEIIYSARWKEMIGYGDDVLTPTIDTFFSFLHPDDKARVQATIAQHLSGETPVYQTEFRLHHKDGSWRWILSRGTALRDAQGKPYRMAGSHTDITEQKKDADALLTLSTAIEQSPVSVVIANLDAEIEYVNPRFSEITGYTLAEARGQNPRILQSGHTQKETYQAMWEALTHGRLWTGELENKRKNGELYWEEALIAPVKNAANVTTHYVAIKIDITKRKHAEIKLAENELMYRSLFENNMYAVMLTDPEKGRVLAANRAAQNLLGLSEDALRQKERAEIVDLSDPRVAQAIATSQQTGHFNGEMTMLHASGRKIPVELSTASFHSPDGQALSTLVVRDIGERKRAEENLRLAAKVFIHAREGIIITDERGDIIDVNASFTQITGYSREEVIGKNPRILGSGQQDGAFYAAMWGKIADDDAWQGEIINRRKNGEIYAEWLTLSTIRDNNNNISNYLGIFSDITEQKEHQKYIEHIAHYDALTGLPNRVLLADRLKQGMVAAQRRQQPLAVAYLDLDGFKNINDTYGHSMGDKLLMQIAHRMKLVVRNGDTVARLGGDEFVAVLQDLSDINSSVPLLLRLLSAASQPVEVGELQLRVSASIGVSYYPQSDEIDADQLLRQADQAMYQAKQSGKNRYHVFDAEQDRSVRGHHEHLLRLQHALAQDEFELYYQPKVNMRSGKVIGAEALIRWQHPERGLLSPAEFLTVAEEHPMAIELGEWVLNTALTQLALWHSLGFDLPVSVNIGARQLQQPDFIERLRLVMAHHPEVKPECLELEVLESSALEDLNQVSKVIEACREMGIKFALDDFGTGYSSLTYLKRLPAHTLKIDQSFVQGMLDDPEDLAIVEGVLSLATAFRREVIAEGVETLEHGLILLQLGCELAQGYGVARPMPAHELVTWTRGWQSPPEWTELLTIQHESIPVLYAAVEHRAWISAILKRLHDSDAPLPALGEHACHFGKWLRSDAHTYYQHPEALREFEALHQKIHALGVSLLELKAQGSDDEVQARVGEFMQLSETLLQHLWMIEREPRPLC